MTDKKNFLQLQTKQKFRKKKKKNARLFSTNIMEYIILLKTESLDNAILAF